MTKKLVLMRGISGSGKSFKAAQILKDTLGVCCSADFFWGNEYKFTPEFLGLAHQWCLAEVVKNMIYGVTPIVVDNTNTQCWEAKRYVEMAQRFGYDVDIAESDSPWCRNPEECFKRNSHGVPLNVIQAQLARWEYDFTVERILQSTNPRDRS